MSKNLILLFEFSNETQIGPSQVGLHPFVNGIV